jgi:hypothetical protein
MHLGSQGDLNCKTLDQQLRPTLFAPFTFFPGEMIQKHRETHSKTDRNRQTERQMGIRSRGREMEIQTGGEREKQREAKVERIQIQEDRECF